jgi:hypothetical protein
MTAEKKRAGFMVLVPFHRVSLPTRSAVGESAASDAARPIYGEGGAENVERE